MTAFTHWYGDQLVRRLKICALVVATAFMLAACEQTQQEQSVPDPADERSRISEPGEMVDHGSLVNEAAADLTGEELAELRQQSESGMAIASDVLAQEAERENDYKKVAHFQSLALMQGSLSEHLSMAIFLAEVAEQRTAGSENVSHLEVEDLCVLWERAIWHTDYVISHASDKSPRGDLTSDYREAAHRWRSEFQSKMKALSVDDKCR